MISDEMIVAAMLESGSIRAAAEKLGISEGVIYDRRRKPEFQTAYQDAKNEVIRSAVYGMNQQLSAAVNTIAEIMTDNTVNPAVRLQAAGLIINNSAKLSAQLERGETESRTKSDPFDFLGVDL